MSTHREMLSRVRPLKGLRRLGSPATGLEVVGEGNEPRGALISFIDLFQDGATQM